jgi:hypothetical protein
VTDVPTFDLFALRFHLMARHTVRFPDGKSGNLLRGSFGKILKRIAGEPEYIRLFQPSAGPQGPSGLRDSPRPFVFRASHLDGKTFRAGEEFSFDVNVFDMRSPVLPYFAQAFTERLGTIQSIDGREPLHLPLTSRAGQPSRLRVRFVTPTELKGADTPEFGVLFARIRDRLSTLRALYGSGPLEIDFKSMGERAGRVRMTSCELQQVEVERVSRSTGQRHSIGGFTGVAEYEGELTEFLPYLEAARYTGVGRQTTWGKGEIVTEAI